MGEIADDMLEGLTCQLCGCFFEDTVHPHAKGEGVLFTHGCPVVCWTCWRGLNKRERKMYQRAERPTL